MDPPPPVSITPGSITPSSLNPGTMELLPTLSPCCWGFGVTAPHVGPPLVPSTPLPHRTLLR